MDTQIIDSMTTLTLWKIWNVGCDILKGIWNVVKKWAEDKWNEKVLGRANNQAVIKKIP
jgi:hypothetical protein